MSRLFIIKWSRSEITCLCADIKINFILYWYDLIVNILFKPQFLRHDIITLTCGYLPKHILELTEKSFLDWVRVGFFPTNIQSQGKAGMGCWYPLWDRPTVVYTQHTLLHIFFLKREGEIFINQSNILQPTLRGFKLSTMKLQS